MLIIGYCRCHDDGHDGISLGIGPGDDSLSQDRKVQELRKVRYLRSSARGVCFLERSSVSGGMEVGTPE